MSNATKNAALGESYGAASNRLRKQVMFKLIQQLGLEHCFRCEGIIESAESLSLEHKDAWLSAEDPKSSFFDLDNIAFSHLSCNSGAADKSWQTNKDHCPRGHLYSEDNVYRQGVKRQCRVCRSNWRRNKQADVPQLADGQR